MTYIDLKNLSEEKIYSQFEYVKSIISNYVTSNKNMPQREIKICFRCKNSFECKVGSITECQCTQIQLSIEERAYIDNKYEDCICINCLYQLRQEYLLYQFDV
ncbi:MAG: cysteine-rich CWC family protein [Chitinophagaceae bacterium]|nr:cysteine-rich CWC family protein [Chitinophagaceae bacterium]MCW5905496.1 cysteine-rich CWC family protein [Chitinophagaceae bacterium]